MLTRPPTLMVKFETKIFRIKSLKLSLQKFKLSFKKFKINAICYTMNVHVLKLCTGCEGSAHSRSIAITFLTSELEW